MTKPSLKRYHPLTPQQQNSLFTFQSTNLDLSHKLLFKSINTCPPSLFPSTLLHLDISSNSLTFSDLPPISHLKSLLHLNISNNPIQLQGLQLLANLRKLEHLNISKIYKVVKGDLKKSRLDFEVVKFVSLTFQGLKTLDIGYNNLGEKAEYGMLNELKGLEDLNLCENAIGEKGERMLNFEGLKKLKRLNLRSNELTSQLIPFLTKLPNLQHLSLAYNYIQQDTIIPLLPHLPCLTSLNLSYNFVSNASIIQITKNLKSLKSLDLRSCRCTLEGFQEIIKQLKELQYLSVNQNQIGFPDNVEVLERVIAGLKESKLKMLQLENNRLYKKQRIRLLKEFMETQLVIKAGY